MSAQMRSIVAVRLGAIRVRTRNVKLGAESPFIRIEVDCPDAPSIAEFADEYSEAERVRFVVVGAIAGGSIVTISKLWLFPWLRVFSESADCQSVFGIRGTTVLGYGLFEGIPLFATLLIIATFGRRGLRILREGRLPPSFEKVFRPTRIERGSKAKAVGYLQLFAATPMLSLLVWGTNHAGAFARRSDSRPSECPAGVPLQRFTPHVR